MWAVELAPAADSDLTVTAIASTLGVRLQPGTTVIDSIVEWCSGRRMLLIIDNCEHVLDPVSDVVRAIVAACPTVTLIATSRSAAGETVVRIASLDERDATELAAALRCLQSESVVALWRPADGPLRQST